MGHLAAEADNEAERQEKVWIQYYGEWGSPSEASQMEQGQLRRYLYIFLIDRTNLYTCIQLRNTHLKLGSTAMTQTEA